MSSILDALGKLESSSSGAPGGPPPPSRSRRWLPALVGVAVVAFVAGVLAMRWLADDDVPAPMVVAEAPAPEPTTPPERPMPPRPVARVIETTPTTAVPPTTPPPPATVPRPATPRPTTPPPAAPPRATPPPRTPPSTSPPAPTPPPTRPAARRPDGAPELRVTFLMYSSQPARRSVALSLPGAGMSTLREGEYFQGVRVLEILPDAVDLEWNGMRYRASARR